MAHGPAHVCGALPKQLRTIALTYCTVHQAWTITAMAYSVDGEDPDEPWYARTLDLGPFDDPADVMAQLLEELGVAMPDLPER